MANDKDKVFLPRMRTRIGKAGYKGKNIVMFDAGSKPAPKPAAVTAPKAAGAKKTPPKTGIKPLKTK